MTLGKKVSIVVDRIISAAAFLAGIFIVFLMLGVSAGVVSRYFLRQPIIWMPETAGYILLYMTFLAAAWVLRLEGHVCIDIVLNRLNLRTRSLINTITSALSIIVCFLLTWFGTKATWDNFQAGSFTTTALELPLFIFLAIIPIGCFLLLIQFVIRTYGNLRRWRT